jgi:cardiolipin synthase
MNNYFIDMIIIFSYFLGVIAAAHALFSKGNPRSALIWVYVCLFIPFIGAFFYIIFGVNRIKLVSQKWRSYGLYQLPVNLTPGTPHPEYDIAALTPYQQELSHVGNQLFKSKITAGCKITPLYDGTQAYPQMLAAITEAKERIYLSTYIFGAQGIGEKFIEALGAAVKRGVEVKVMIDGVGSLYTWPRAKGKLKALGVDARIFSPLGFSVKDLRCLNLRSHEKIMVVDGALGFTGGMNIHEKNLGSIDELPKIHDLHFKVEGPIISDLQDAFLRNWYFNSKQTPKQQLYYDNRIKGNMGVRSVTTGPYQAYPVTQFLLVAAINAAKQHIRIMTPYFIIGSALNVALIEATLRGVKVELILPESNNLSFVKGASEALFLPLLNFGVKVYYRKGHFTHSKIFIVDDNYVFLGSSNMDTRSFYLNFEFNLEVYSKDLAGQLLEHFKVSRKISREITAEWLQNQKFIIKLRNSICKLFSPYL